MKYFIKPILLFLLVGEAFICNAQIGINTTNIENNIVLKISSTNNSNNVVIDKTGNVGIGTTAPTAKLDIETGGTPSSPNPQLKINTGTQAIGRALQSDENGIGTWADYTTRAIFGKFSTTGVTISPTTVGYVNTGTILSLPPGTWLIFCNLDVSVSDGTSTVTGNRIYTKFSFSDNSTSTTLTPDLIGVDAIGNSILINGSASINNRCIIQNTTTTTKNYYLLASIDATNNTTASLIDAGKSSDSNSLFAFLITLEQ